MFQNLTKLNVQVKDINNIAAKTLQNLTSVFIYNGFQISMKSD